MSKGKGTSFEGCSNCFSRDVFGFKLKGDRVLMLVVFLILLRQVDF